MKNSDKCNSKSSLNAATVSLYRNPIEATRSGPIYNAFPYPTKISPEAIAIFIATHTNPGDTVFDGFSGSGTTGLAALLCANPTEGMKHEAKRLNLPVRWGYRRAVLYEIGVLGSFVSRVLCSPPNPTQFQKAATQLLNDVEKRVGWLYNAADPSGNPGTIRYMIWSDILRCPSCRKKVLLWDACVKREPVDISGIFHCPYCYHEVSVDTIKHITHRVDDDFVGEKLNTRERQIAWIYGSTGRHNWSRAASVSDLKLMKQIDAESVPDNVPLKRISWGDLYRSGYHEGITHLHHFYTRRNLIVFSSLWAEVDKYPVKFKDALRFLLLSYNASHSTIMTRVVGKAGQKDFVVTSAQPGVLYISGLPVEKNIFSGLRRKLSTITRAFNLTHGCPEAVTVHNSSCLSVDLPDESVDYVFTDPPFGGNIPYAEVNFLNEAWLGNITNTTDEAIISPCQGKTTESYQELLFRAFIEVNRILKRDAKVTVVFHSTSAQVWNALRCACVEAGFGIERSSVLDKTQGSFKQVTTDGAVRGDPLLLLTKSHKRKNGKSKDVWVVADDLMKKAEASDDPEELSPQRIFSRLVAHYVSCQQDVPIDAGKFYRQLTERLAVNGYSNQLL